MPRPTAAPPAPPLAARCAVHPSRPAAGACPVCGRPRCAADVPAAGAPAGCAACGGVAAPAGPRPADDRERLVAGALGGLGAALVAGSVWAQYVGAPYMAYLAPFVLGLAVGFVAFRAARTEGAAEARTPLAARVRWLALGYAVLGAAWGLRLEGSVGLLEARALVPALLAAAGCWLWTAPPRRRPVSPEAGPAA